MPRPRKSPEEVSATRARVARDAHAQRTKAQLRRQTAAARAASPANKPRANA
jgi:hypothetical protein